MQTENDFITGGAKTTVLLMILKLRVYDFLNVLIAWHLKIPLLSEYMNGDHLGEKIMIY